MARNSIAQKSFSQLQLEIAIPRGSRPASNNKGKGTRLVLFRPQLHPQLVLLPSELESRLPENHFVFFILDTVRGLNLSGILSRYEKRGGVGRPAYDPIMMLSLILYCYCTGVTSARGIERECRENVPCLVITGNQTPDHDTISNFLKLHRAQFDDIFQQILVKADGLGLIKLDHAALDGSKLHANASKRKAMSYDRMCQAEEKLPADCAELTARIAELEKLGHKRALGEATELKEDVKFKKKKLARIKSAKKKLERRAREKARLEAKAKTKLQKQGRKIRKIPDPKTVLPEPTDQINFTDSDSRIMGKKGGAFEQCYNVQIVADSRCQIIVAHDVVQHANDKLLLVPMLQQVESRLGRLPATASADAGYFSEESITNSTLSSIELLVPPDRESHPRTSLAKVGRIAKDISTADRMRRKLATTRGKELYAQRKCIVEPVYGQVKESVLEFNQFSWRGLTNVREQWALVCTAHNLVKIFRARKNDQQAKPSTS